MIVRKKKYYWKKHLKYIVSKDPKLKQINVFEKKFSLFCLPIFLFNLLTAQINNQLKKKDYVLIYGKLILYKSGVSIIFIENLKFKIEKTKNIVNRNIKKIIYKHNLIFNICFSDKFYDLIPLL
jgi:hypothetical protein